MDVTLSPVSDADEQFLFRVFAGTRADEVSALPWDETQVQAFLKMQFTAQARDYGERFPRADHHLILAGDEPVGRLYVDRRQDEIRILDITVLPEHRNHGTGSEVLGRLIDEAAHGDLPIRIWVEEHNPSYRLFARLGFVSIEQDSFLHLLERPPLASHAAPVASSTETGASDRLASPSLPEGRSHETH